MLRLGFLTRSTWSSRVHFPEACDNGGMILHPSVAKRGLGHEAAINRSTCRDPERTQREEWKAGTKKLPSPLACTDLGAAFFYSLIKHGGVPTIFQTRPLPWEALTAPWKLTAKAIHSCSRYSVSSFCYKAVQGSHVFGIRPVLFLPFST